MKQIRKLAQEKNKKLVYNRNLGGYQITSGFTASEVVYPYRDDKGRLGLNDEDKKILISYI